MTPAVEGSRVETTGQEQKKQREDRAAGLAVLCIFSVLFLTWGAYLLVVADLLRGHLHWLVVNLTPKAKALALWSGFGLVPLCLLLAAFRRTRLAAGMGFFTISGVFTFVTAASCAMYTEYVWSWTGLLLGTALVGYGIVPVGLVAALLHRRWDIAGAITSGAIMMFSAMYFGLALMTLSFSAAPLRLPDAEDDEPSEE